MDHEWPGNVRELQRALEACVMLSEARIDDELVAGQIHVSGSGAPTDMKSSVDLVSRATIERVLKTSPSVTAAARKLGLSRRHLHRLIRHFGLKV